MEIGGFQRAISCGLRFLRQTLRIRKSTNLHSTPTLIARRHTGFSNGFTRSLLFSRDVPVGLVNTRVKCVWESISFQLRKQGVQRLISGLNGRPRSYITLLSFGFVGFALSEDNGRLVTQSTSKDSDDLEGFFATVRKENNTKQDQSHCDQDDTCFPDKLDGYEVQRSLIAKGCFGALYPAYIRPVKFNSLVSQVPESSEISCQDEGSSGLEITQDGASSATEEDEWELVSQEKMATNSDPDISLPSLDADIDNTSPDWSVISMNRSGSHPQSHVDHSSNPLQVPLQVRSSFENNGTYHLKGEFNLAIKIYVGSTSNEEIFKVEKIVLDDKSCEKDNRSPFPPHPNIITIHRAFTEENVSAERFKEVRSLFPEALPLPQFNSGIDKLMFLVMKRYDMTLREYIQEFGYQSEEMAKMMLCQSLEGISHLTSVGVAHRDLKSDNILLRKVDRSGVPLLVITDFGCCLDGRETGLHVPLDSQSRLVGNTALRAPEIQIAYSDYWASHLDYRKSDGWALGTIAYEMCGMPNPFYERGASSISYKKENLPSLPGFVSPEFEFVIMGLLRKDPNERLECKEAADMIHLLLWKQEYWAKGPVNLRKISYLKQILYGWLYNVAYPENDCLIEERSRVMIQLQSTFLSRVQFQELLKAGKKLVAVRWMAWLNEMSAMVFS